MLRAAMLFALSTSHKIGLAGMGALFIVFSLASSFLAPRLNANFPGRGMKVYLAICVCFFVAMISSVLVFDVEEPEAEAAGATATETTGETTTTTPAATGDPAAGKIVFTANGCGACHAFAPAASTGAVGPSLDKLAEAAAAANQSLEAFARESVVNPDAVIAAGFAKGLMPPTFGTSLSKKQLDDLVAFLTQSP